VKCVDVFEKLGLTRDIFANIKDINKEIIDLEPACQECPVFQLVGALIELPGNYSSLQKQRPVIFYLKT
jgi:hypothetical protein